ncbi:MAG: hypothetical protein AAF989_14715 [Planctomycetota bacterium]
MAEPFFVVIVFVTIVGNVVSCFLVVRGRPWFGIEPLTWDSKMTPDGNGPV